MIIKLAILLLLTCLALTGVVLVGRFLDELHARHLQQVVRDVRARKNQEP